MAKLSIIVTHFQEPMETCRFLFDSLDIQHGIDKSDFNVLVVNDGDEGALTREDIGDRTYQVDVVTVPHGGVSKARNYGIEHADGENHMRPLIQNPAGKDDKKAAF